MPFATTVWTPIRLAKFVEYRNANLPNAEIVKRLGIRRFSVNNALRHLPDLPRRSINFNARIWTPEKIQRFIQYRNSGMRNPEIAKKFNVSISVISHVVSRWCPTLPRHRYGWTPIWTDARIAEIEDMLDEVPRPRYADIGARIGCSKNAIAGAVWRHVVKQQPAPAVPIELPEPKRCMWPHGDPGSPGFHFCGATTAGLGDAYCLDHRAVAYVRPKVEKQAA
jgi:hypothetical protein